MNEESTTRKTFDFEIEPKIRTLLAITLELKEIRLSYYTCVLLVTRPFSPYQKCWPHDLDIDFLPTFEKNLTLNITFYLVSVTAGGPKSPRGHM